MDNFNDDYIVLAAEDYPDNDFAKYHIFTQYEDKIIRKLIAHGPLLLRGGKGCGKTALLKETYYRINNQPYSDKVFGIYMTLKHLPLLRNVGKKYEYEFCKLLIDHINEALKKYEGSSLVIDTIPSLREVQKELTNLAVLLNKRIILIFDDVAHIAREASTREFFNIFRTLSNNVISIKAAIYPGVSEFGTRFESNVIDIARNEELPYYRELFLEIIKTRFSKDFIEQKFSASITLDKFVIFIGRAVNGNVRAFILACNKLIDIQGDNTVGLPELEKTLKIMALEYFWPLLDEVKQKLGRYESLVELTREVSEYLIDVVSESMNKPEHVPSFIIHSKYVHRFQKILELLEYIGFIMKREASKAMKYNGRGTRYILNQCIMMERVRPNKLSNELFERFIKNKGIYAEICQSEVLEVIELPEPSDSDDLKILNESIDILEKSPVYPYGLTKHKIEILKEAGLNTIEKILTASDEKVLSLNDIGQAWLVRIRGLARQAVWM